MRVFTFFLGTLRVIWRNRPTYQISEAPFPLFSGVLELNSRLGMEVWFLMDKVKPLVPFDLVFRS